MLSQLVLNVYIMALTFAGSWLTFPRSVLLVNLFVGTFVLFIFNVLVYLLYQQLRGQKKILVVGESDRALEAVRNFSLMKIKCHKEKYVVFLDYLKHVMKLTYL